MDLLLGSLADLDGLLDRQVPAVLLSITGCLEGVLLVVDLESDLVCRSLLQVGGVVECEHILRVCPVDVVLLVEEEQTLAGLACPRSDGV